jgi:hypothetical protein
MRVLVYLLALGAMLAAPAWAQVEVGQNTSLSLSGDLGFGYDGEYGNQTGSSHGTSLNGDAVLQGYYYNPKFVSFFVDPIYNRSQANSGQGSITDASSVNAGVNIFSGSHFPGSISFGEGFDSSGIYGFGTTPGLTTTSGKSHSFGIGWAELIPGAPPLSVQYSQTASSNSIFATDQEDHTSTKSLNMFSNYKLAGWYLGGRFTNIRTHTELPSVITDEGSETGDTDATAFSANANHKLPLRGSFGVGYTWSEFSGENNGTTLSGSNQMINATAAFAPTQRLTSSFELDYNSSLTGEIEQQLVGVGAVNPQVNLGTSGYSIAMSNYDNVALTKSLSAGFSVGHIQQEVYGETVSATHFSAIVNYRFLKPLWGTVVLYAGVNDQANEGGNQGAGLVAGANFSKQWSNFQLSGSFGYSQDTQTVLADQTTSNYTYLANAQRRLSRRIRWMGTFSGFHTGLGELEGSSAHAENYGTNLVFKMYNVGADYSHTSGTALLTANGLVAPPGTISPTLPGNDYLLDTGSSYSFSFTANPIRKLTFSSSYTKTINDSQAQTLATNSASRVFLVFTTYQFRKMEFTSGYTNLNQFVSAAGLPEASYSNFYVGLQRWFKAF